jgi:hypothetical protein
MTEQSVISTVIEVLKECQTAFGHDDGDSITPDTVPHGGLKGFQSDVTPTIVRRVAKRLGGPLADEVDPVNIFASEDKKKLSVKEAAKRFLGLYGQGPKGGK